MTPLSSKKKKDDCFERSSAFIGFNAQEGKNPCGYFCFLRQARASPTRGADMLLDRVCKHRRIDMGTGVELRVLEKAEPLPEMGRLDWQERSPITPGSKERSTKGSNTIHLPNAFTGECELSQSPGLSTVPDPASPSRPWALCIATPHEPPVSPRG